MHSGDYLLFDVCPIIDGTLRLKESIIIAALRTGKHVSLTDSTLQLEVRSAVYQADNITP